MSGLTMKFKKIRKMKSIDGEVYVPMQDLSLNVEALDYYANAMNDMANTTESAFSKATFLNRRDRTIELSDMMKETIGYCVDCKRGTKDIQTGFTGFDAAAMGQEINDRA